MSLGLISEDLVDQRLILSLNLSTLWVNINHGTGNMMVIVQLATVLPAIVFLDGSDSFHDMMLVPCLFGQSLLVLGDHVGSIEALFTLRSKLKFDLPGMIALVLLSGILKRILASLKIQSFGVKRVVTF